MMPMGGLDATRAILAVASVLIVLDRQAAVGLGIFL